MTYSTRRKTKTALNSLYYNAEAWNELEESNSSAYCEMKHHIDMGAIINRML